MSNVSYSNFIGQFLTEKEKPPLIVCGLRLCREAAILNADSSTRQWQQSLNVHNCT
jgi:hypothetical protein